METIRILLKNGHDWISPSLSEWRVQRYKIVMVLFDQAIEGAKLLYIYASALNSRTFRSSATPELASNIIAIIASLLSKSHCSAELMKPLSSWPKQ